ncbi:peptidoglycan-binding domain-containing protein [Oricola thermophila]|uniref:Peptidoglycan-binding protein n=1 Tax=Oricola thermophila TaxID=2742145 RepID=A0A6N1VG93_9HYPH|nr:peptidoglycan-binding protein [Oricola thermophila]QKV18665.1 peptidoglycan-binding protein [Oricola thermophila]
MTVYSVLRGGVSWIGERIAENPGSAGAVTAFAVAMAFFSANAVYFQDGRHPSAFFATRPEHVGSIRKTEPVAPVSAAERNEVNVTRFLLREPDAGTARRPEIPLAAPLPARRPAVVLVEDAAKPVDLSPEGDATLAGIQELLTKLGYYEGDVDGLRGPKTNAAIEAYKNNVGLRGIELTDAELMTSIRNNLDVTAAIPAPRPKPVAPVQIRNGGGESESALEGAATELPPERQIPSEEVVKVQAGLRAFGNTDIVVDGVAGEQTEAAIREFQSLFRLPVTGRIDGVLLDKMRAVGLIQ